MQSKFSFFILLSLSLSLLGCGVSSYPNSNHFNTTSLAGGIINGQTVPEDTPIANQVVLITQNLEYTNNKPDLFGICTGIIIDSRTVLTAAHCLENGLAKMKILTRTNPREELSPNDIYTPIGFRTHKNYINRIELEKKVDLLKTKKEKLKALSENADLALLFLDRPFDQQFKYDLLIYDESQQSFDLNESINLLVAGYGRTSSLINTSKIPYDQLNGVLKSAKVTSSRANLLKAGFPLPQWKKPGICTGDSGGPVFIKNNTGQLQLMAMATTVYQIDSITETEHDPTRQHNACASHGFFLNLKNYKDWIFESVLWLNFKYGDFQNPKTQ